MEADNGKISDPVLFVCSGNRLGHCTAAIMGQQRALEESGVRVSFFYIRGGGVGSYIKSVFRLRRLLKEDGFYVIHAHYGLSAVVASLAGARPLIVSLMGSDVYGLRWIRGMVRFFAAHIWPVTIVKSEQMVGKLNLNNLKVIPNGVDFSLFREVPKRESRQKAGFHSAVHILWPADPLRDVKNFGLARAAIKMLKTEGCELSVIKYKGLEEMPEFYNAADVVLVTSRWEGSPNVVKEALACNIPVVSTAVGDVEKWLSGIEGCKVCDSDALSIARGLEYALTFKGRIRAREQISELDNRLVIEELLNIYKRQAGKTSNK